MVLDGLSSGDLECIGQALETQKTRSLQLEIRIRGNYYATQKSTSLPIFMHVLCTNKEKFLMVSLSIGNSFVL